MCPFSLETFTWQVVATLIAAGIAGLVGWRQVGIADGQRKVAEAQAETAQAAIKIAEAQALTARLAQRASLFDRRMKVYTTIQEYLHTGLRGDEEGLMALDLKVKEALNEARFLFPDRVSRVLLEALSDADLCANEARNPIQSERKDHAEGLRKLRHKLRETLSSLSETMGDEMSLYMESGTR